MDVSETTFRSLARRSRMTAILTLLGAMITLGALVFSSFQLKDLTHQVGLKGQKVERLEDEIDLRQKQIDSLKQTADGLFETQSDILEFLSNVTRRENIRLFDESVDWPKLKADILQMPAGKRKQTLLIALLYAWKDIPFKLGGESLGDGIDSSQFLQRVLSDIEVTFDVPQRGHLSELIMSQLDSVEVPKPGDLVFYKGQIGNFGFLILSVNDGGKADVGVGTLQREHPLQVVHLDNINIKYYPMVGYFHVKYPDE